MAHATRILTVDLPSAPSAWRSVAGRLSSAPAVPGSFLVLQNAGDLSSDQPCSPSWEKSLCVIRSARSFAPIFEHKSGCRVYTSRFVRFIPFGRALLLGLCLKQLTNIQK